MMFICLLFLFCSTNALNLTEEQYNSFPRLFHLDDYQRCLAARRGLYCIGSFTLAAAGNNSHFHLLQAYSELSYNFNRTRLHRGYCVSERCPFEQNATLRFERCVAKHAQRYSLSAHLSAAECTTHRSRQERANLAPDAAQRLFLYAVCFILMLNVVGTVCDVYSKPGDDKWRLLKCWSVLSNWRKLLNRFNTSDADARAKSLACIHGLRAIAVLITLGVHTIVVSIMVYSYHPHIVEQAFQSIWGKIVIGATSLLHVFVMISSFLTTYIIMSISDKYDLSIKMLPVAIIKRVVRVSPTYIFMVGFAATWWYSVGDGPLWSPLVGMERSNCRKNFWAHVFYVNNLVDDSSGYCVTPTWFLAADLHTNIIVSTLALIMAKWGRKAIATSAFLWIISCVMITGVAYINSWQSMIYSADPDKIRAVYVNFEDQNVFHHLHMSSWILLPASFLGMFCAFLHEELQKVGFKPSDHKLLKVVYNLGFPLIFVWLLFGVYLKNFKSPMAMALEVGFHRPIFCVIAGILLMLSHQFRESIQSKVFAWKFWNIPSQLSLPVLMLHWFVLITMVARSQHAISFNFVDIVFNWIVMLVITYALAVPVSVLLEIPAQRFLETLVFRQKIKTN